MCPRRIIDNVTNIVMASNEDHVIPAGVSSRRYHVYDMKNTFIKMAKHDKKELYNVCPYAVARYLYNVNIKNFVPYEEAVESSGLTFQKMQSMDPMQKWWTDLLSQYYNDESDGYQGNVKFGESFQKSHLFDHYKFSVKTYAKTAALLWMQIRKYVTAYDESLDRKLLTDDAFGKKSRKMFCTLPDIETCIAGWNTLFGCSVIELKNK